MDAITNASLHVLEYIMLRNLANISDYVTKSETRTDVRNFETTSRPSGCRLTRRTIYLFSLTFLLRVGVFRYHSAKPVIHSYVA